MHAGGAIMTMWRGRSLALAAIAFAAGSRWPAPILGIALMVVGVVGLWSRRSGLIIVLGFGLAMTGAGSTAAGWRSAPAEAPFAGGFALVEAWIVKAPDRRPGGHRLTLDVVGYAGHFTEPVRAWSGRVSLTVGPGAFDGRPGDRVRAWAKWRAHRSRAFPGGFDGAWWAAYRGYQARGWARSAGDVVVVDRSERWTVRIAMETLRDAIHRSISRAVPGPSGSVIRAFATGDTSGIDFATQEDFRRSGLSHLLAVSGLNLAIISGLFVVGVGAVLRRWSWVVEGPGVERVVAAAALPFVVAYTLLVGASPSAVRAAWMVGWVLVARAFRRRTDIATTLGGASLGLLAVDPWSLDDPSTQLSFAAVAGLLWVYPALEKRSPLPQTRGLKSAVQVAIASLAATLATLPIVAAHFQRVSWVGVLVNVPAAPVSSFVLVPLALVGGLLGIVWPEGAAPILQIADWAAALLIAMAQGAAWVPGGATEVPRFGWWPTVGYYLCLAGALSGVRSARRWTIGAGILTVGLLFQDDVRRPFRDDLTVTFLPVGQGDAAVIELPFGRTMVVDTGPNLGATSAVERVLLPFLRERGLRRVDWLVLSHPHADHIADVAGLAEAVPIGEIWWSGDEREATDTLLDPIRARSPVRVTARKTLKVGSVTVEVLAPDQAWARYSTVNDASVVLMLSHGDHRILLTGDAQAESEARMVQAWGEGLRADVLKLGHHGSRTSTSEGFLRTVAPAHAIVSAGLDNRFGFPHREVTERLRRAGVRVWRTDLHGAVTVRSTGASLSVSSFRPSSSTGGAPRSSLGRRGFEVLGGGRLQGPGIESTGSSARHPAEEKDLAGQHVAGQPPLELLPDEVGLRFALFRYDEQHQLVSEVGVRHGDGRGVIHRALDFGHRLELAQIHSVPPDLVNAIASSAKDQLTTVIVNRAVARPEHRLFEDGLQRVENEALVGPLGGIPITRCHRGAHDDQLALSVRLGDELALLVEQNDIVVVEGPPDRNGFVVVLGDRGHAKATRQAGLGLAVDVDQLGVRSLFPQLADVAPAHRLPGEDNRAHARYIAAGEGVSADESHESGRHRIPDRDPVRIDEAAHFFGEREPLFRNDGQLGAGGEGAEHVEHRQVDRQRCVRCDDVFRRQTEVAGHRFDERERLAVSDRDALRSAGRAARVEHVGKIAIARMLRVARREGRGWFGGPPDDGLTERIGDRSIGWDDEARRGARLVDLLQALEGPARGHQNPSSAVLYDEPHARRWRFGVDGHVGGAGLEDPDHPGDRGGRFELVDGDAVAALDAHAAQLLGDFETPSVQLGVGQCAIGADDRDRVWRSARGSLNERSEGDDRVIEGVTHDETPGHSSVYQLPGDLATNRGLDPRRKFPRSDARATIGLPPTRPVRRCGDGGFRVFEPSADAFERGAGQANIRGSSPVVGGQAEGLQADAQGVSMNAENLGGPVLSASRQLHCHLHEGPFELRHDQRVHVGGSVALKPLGVSAQAIQHQRLERIVRIVVRRSHRRRRRTGLPFEALVERVAHHRRSLPSPVGRVKRSCQTIAPNRFPATTDDQKSVRSAAKGSSHA